MVRRVFAASVIGPELEMCKLLRNFCTNDTGATAIEYGFIAAFVSMAGVIAWVSMGDSLQSSFESVTTDLTYAIDTMGD